MTHPFTPKSQSTDSDIAYNLLLTQGHSMNYQDLIREVLKVRGLPVDPGMLSAVLTQINLDTRFNYLGKGEWGLRAWVTSRGTRKVHSISSLNKALVEDEDEADLDEEKDLLSEDDFEGSQDEEEEDSHHLTEIPFKNMTKLSDEDSWN